MCECMFGHQLAHRSLTALAHCPAPKDGGHPQPTHGQCMYCAHTLSLMPSLPSATHASTSTNAFPGICWLLPSLSSTALPRPSGELVYRVPQGASGTSHTLSCAHMHMHECMYWHLPATALNERHSPASGSPQRNSSQFSSLISDHQMANVQ